MSEYEGAKSSFFEFEPKNKDLSLLADEARQTSIFREKKLLITSGLLEHVGTDKETVSFLARFNESSEIIIILAETKSVPKKQSLSRIFSKTYETDSLKADQLERWIFDEIKSRGGEIDGLALKKLIDITGNDLWVLSNEIDKLISYTKRGKISSGDIDLLVKPKTESDIFKAIDYMAVKDRRGALKMIYSHLEKGDSVPYLISMIGFQFRNLLLVKNNDSRSGDLDMHPFVFRKASNQSRRFSKEGLMETYRGIVSSDTAIKTGKIEPGTALDLLVFKM